MYIVFFVLCILDNLFENCSSFFVVIFEKWFSNINGFPISVTYFGSTSQQNTSLLDFPFSKQALFQDWEWKTVNKYWSITLWYCKCSCNSFKRSNVCVLHNICCSMRMQCLYVLLQYIYLNGCVVLTKINHINNPVHYKFE